MYSFKKEKSDEVKSKFKLVEMAKVIGISVVHLNRVINNKCNCSKVVAYCISKYINKNAEISEFFNKVD